MGEGADYSAAKGRSDVGNPNGRDLFTAKCMIKSSTFNFRALPLLIVAGVLSATFSCAMSPYPKSHVEKNKDISGNAPRFLVSSSSADRKPTTRKPRTRRPSTAKPTTKTPTAKPKRVHQASA